MRKKNYTENSDREDNEFDVDEPEAIQNNASDDDWTPDKTDSSRRTSTRLRNIPKSRAPIIDASSSEEEGSDGEAGGKRKGKGRGRQPAKKSKVSSTSTTPVKSTPTKGKAEEGASKAGSSDSEPTSTTVNSATASPQVSSPKVIKDFSSGAFILLKTDAAKLEEDPPLWKIDGKALLQKYIPFQQEGQTLYKNTSVYSGWTMNNRNNYFPVAVIFKQQTRKDHIVEFKRDQITKEDLENIGKETEESKNGNVKYEAGEDMEDDDEDLDEEEDENEDEENEDEEDGGEEEEDGEEDGEDENGDAEESDIKEEKKDEEESASAELKKEKD